MNKLTGVSLSTTFPFSSTILTYKWGITVPTVETLLSIESS